MDILSQIPPSVRELDRLLNQKFSAAVTVNDQANIARSKIAMKQVLSALTGQELATAAARFLAELVGPHAPATSERQ
jgi:hypothetical protein